MCFGSLSEGQLDVLADSKPSQERFRIKQMLSTAIAMRSNVTIETRLVLKGTAKPYAGEQSLFVIRRSDDLRNEPFIAIDQKPIGYIRFQQILVSCRGANEDNPDECNGFMPF